ncbi:FAD-dependent oxidoreductase [Microbacterium sp. NPDC077644]|uniref:FAD-dependent oxidoreductase n=1 Tax=Microbacterium sp. NPDC077644 TaxID=3155055 RepID=UPI00344C0C7D
MTESFDVVVLGSGIAGLTAAFTAASKGLSVAVLEKWDKLGGSTAWSAGQIWIANNPYETEAGIDDSEQDAVDYLMSLSRGILDEEVARNLARNGPRVLDYLDEVGKIGLYIVNDVPDYHPSNPGGKPGGGRTLEMPLFPFSELGEWADKVTMSPYLPKNFKSTETMLGAVVPQPPSAEELKRREITDERGMGQAIIGWLLKLCLDNGVVVYTEHRATQLVETDGRITGVIAQTPAGENQFDGSRGVILATGGFEWNENLKKTFLRGPLNLPVTVPTSEGDGLYMARKVGADLQNMREAWWSPIAELPAGVNSMNRAMVSSDRTRPRSIMVNRAGRRFANEAASYNALGGALHQEDVASFSYANLPAYLVFDQGYMDLYGSVGAPADAEHPWLKSAETLADLAVEIDVPADVLVATVERWNANVASGHDPDFHRGESAHDLWWGDPYKKGTIEGTLGPIDKGPFYALEVNIGSLGTKGGPRTDEHTRVIDLDGNVIEGLYAAGNVSSPLGMAYTGAGGTLGPCLVYGFLAGEHVSHII